MHRLTTVLGLIVALTLVLSCGRFMVKRAPLDEIPEDMETQDKIDLLEKMTQEYPKDPMLFYTLGNLYYDDALPSLARSRYETALKLDPKMNKARVNLAMVLAELDEPDSALILLEEALKIDPCDTKAFTNIGVIYYSRRDFDHAVKNFTKAIECDPNNIEAHYNLGLAFAESGLLLEAIREWETVLDLEEEGEIAQRTRLSLERVERILKR